MLRIVLLLAAFASAADGTADMLAYMESNWAAASKANDDGRKEIQARRAGAGTFCRSGTISEFDALLIDIMDRFYTLNLDYADGATKAGVSLDKDAASHRFLAYKDSASSRILLVLCGSAAPQDKATAETLTALRDVALKYLGQILDAPTALQGPPKPPACVRSDSFDPLGRHPSKSPRDALIFRR